MISIPFLCKYMATWGDKGSKKQEVAKAEQTTSVGRAARCEVRGHLCHLHPLPSQLGLDGRREVPRERCISTSSFFSWCSKNVGGGRWLRPLPFKGGE